MSRPHRSHGRRSVRRRVTLAAGACLAVGAIVAGTAVAQASPSTPASQGKAGFQASCPVDAQISQGYGNGHDGVDLANNRGTPEFAAGPGEVIASGPASGYGQWVRIKHPDGSVTEYGHMYERFVKVGDHVEGGQKIASMGSEGQSTGPHLHFEVHLDGGTGTGDDPIKYMADRGVQLPCKP